MIKLWLSHGANPFLKAWSGAVNMDVNAIQLANYYGRNKLVEYLKVAPELRKNAIRGAVTRAIEKNCGCTVRDVAGLIVEKMLALEED